jgi:hypothetical protein
LWSGEFLRDINFTWKKKQSNTRIIKFIVKWWDLESAANKFCYFSWLKPWIHMRFVWFFFIKYVHAGLIEFAQKIWWLESQSWLVSTKTYIRLFFDFDRLRRLSDIVKLKKKLICKLSSAKKSKPKQPISVHPSDLKLSLSNFRVYIKIFVWFVLTLNSLESYFFCPNVSIVLIWKQNYEKFKIVAWFESLTLMLRGRYTRDESRKNPLTQFSNQIFGIKKIS